MPLDIEKLPEEIRNLPGAIKALEAAYLLDGFISGEISIDEHIEAIRARRRLKKSALLDHLQS